MAPLSQLEADTYDTQPTNAVAVALCRVANVVRWVVVVRGLTALADPRHEPSQVLLVSYCSAERTYERQRLEGGEKHMAHQGVHFLR